MYKKESIYSTMEIIKGIYPNMYSACSNEKDIHI